MKKFIKNYLLLTSLAISPLLTYTVSCTEKSHFIDSNFSQEESIFSKQLKWDVYNEGEITEQKLLEKITKIANASENKQYFNHGFYSYDTPEWTDNDYYVKLNLNLNNTNNIALEFYKKNDNEFKTFDLSFNITYRPEKEVLDSIYNNMLGFHKQVTSIDYYKDLKDMKLKDVSSKIYDDFFKTTFIDNKKIDKNDNISVPAYKIIEKVYFSNPAKYNIYSHGNDLKWDTNSLTPFVLQAFDTDSNLKLDLLLFWDKYNFNNIPNFDGEHFKFYFNKKTETFINKKLSEVLDFKNNNLSFIFNWQPGENKLNDSINWDVFNTKRTTLNKEELIKKEGSDFDSTNNLEKSKSINLNKLPLYNSGVYKGETLNRKFLDLSNFTSIKNKETKFIENLFLEKNNMPWGDTSATFRSSFSLFNSLYIFISLGNIYDPTIEEDHNGNFAPLFVFANRGLKLSINNTSVNFNFSLDDKEELSISTDVNENDWEKFYNNINGESSNNVLNVEFINDNSEAFIKGDFKFAANIV